MARVKRGIERKILLGLEGPHWAIGRCNGSSDKTLGALKIKVSSKTFL